MSNTLSDQSEWKMVPQALKRERFYPAEAVKSFIKQLKEKIRDNALIFDNCRLAHSEKQIMLVHTELSRVIYQINQLAGDKLI